MKHETLVHQFVLLTSTATTAPAPALVTAAPPPAPHLAPALGGGEGGQEARHHHHCHLVGSDTRVSQIIRIYTCSVGAMMENEAQVPTVAMGCCCTILI